MLKNLLRIVACCLLTFTAQAQNVSTVPTKLKVGFAIPLSGNGSWMGQNLKAGVELYLKETPAARERLELFYEDETTSNTTMGVTAVKSLIENKKVDALVVFLSPVAYAAAPIVERMGIPTFAITGSDTAKDRTYMVKLWLSTKAEGEAIAKELLKHPEWKTIAFITSEQDSMLARTKAAKEAIDDQDVDINIVFEENVTDAETLNLFASKIAQKKPDVIVINLMPGQVGLFAKKLWEKTYHGQLIGCSTMTDKNEQVLAQGALSGSLYVDSEYSPDFIEAFARDNGSFPLPGAANGYDAIKILDTAFQASGGTDHQKLNKNIRIKDFKGALGNYSFIEDEFNTFDHKAVIRRLE